MSSRSVTALLSLALSALVTWPLRGQDAGEALIRRLNAAHRGQWFTTLTFVQHTTFGGTARPAETWYESMRRPGLLRLDVERDGRMISRTIFRHDSVYATGPNGNTVARPQVHDLLVLLHDLHVGDADVIVRTLRQVGYDLSRAVRAQWRDRPVTIVGVSSVADSASRQFWVDDTSELVVRVRERTSDGSFRDIHVGAVAPVARGSVEQEVEMFSNGRLTLREDYQDVHTDVDLPAAVFDPAVTALPGWVQATRVQRSDFAARVARTADSLRAIAAPAGGFAAAPVAVGDAARVAMVLRIDDGRWIPPHTHNLPKHLMVLQGTLLVGHGERLATTGLHEVGSGGTTRMSPQTAHYEGARGLTLVLLEAGAGFTTTWVGSGAR